MSTFPHTKPLRKRKSSSSHLKSNAGFCVTRRGIDLPRAGATGPYLGRDRAGASARANETSFPDRRYQISRKLDFPALGRCAMQLRCTPTRRGSLSGCRGARRENGRKSETRVAACPPPQLAGVADKPPDRFVRRRRCN